MIVKLLSFIIGFIVSGLIFLYLKKDKKFNVIENKNRQIMSDPFYFHIQTSTSDDPQENHYLFTQEQMDVAKERALKNKEDYEF